MWAAPALQTAMLTPRMALAPRLSFLSVPSRVSINWSIFSCRWLGEQVCGCVQQCRCTKVQVFQGAGVQGAGVQGAGVPRCRCSKVQVSNDQVSDEQVSKEQV